METKYTPEQLEAIRQAAPELLEALKDAADQLFRLALADAHRWTGDVNGTKALEHANKVCAPARAAIAKATGNTL